MRLEPVIVISRLTRITNFNSIKVRLELIGSYKVSREVLDFNSIKVRLERMKADGYRYDSPLFQFHKGAIRTYRVRYLIRIETYFNSIKVRLEHEVGYLVPVMN